MIPTYRLLYGKIRMMNVSVILTVKNEGETIERLLDSLLDQTRPADQVIIVDGGSTDDTLAVLSEYRERLPLQIVVAAGTNISQGRNQAIALAAGPIIASTDAGVVLDPQWLSELVKPLEQGEATVVGGWFEPDPHTDFEVAMGATVLPDLSDIDPDTFLPSSRSLAFKKGAWNEAGGYPEWLDYCEDLIFDLALRDKFGPFAFAPRAVGYFRPRGSLGAFARQYYLYARGDGKANLWPRRHLIRYLAYLVGLPAILSLITRGNPLGWLSLLAGVAVYVRRPAQRLWPVTQGWSVQNRLRAFAQIPLIRLVGDLAKMIGYPVGIMWRWRHFHRDSAGRAPGT